MFTFLLPKMHYFIVLLALVYAVESNYNIKIRHPREPNSIYNDKINSNTETYYLRNQDETLAKIERLLDKITWYVIRLQSPPQPTLPSQPQIVYFPYPVPYALPQYLNTTLYTDMKNLFYPHAPEFWQHLGSTVEDKKPVMVNGKVGSRSFSSNPVDKTSNVENGKGNFGHNLFNSIEVSRTNMEKEKYFIPTTAKPVKSKTQAEKPRQVLAAFEHTTSKSASDTTRKIMTFTTSKPSTGTPKPFKRIYTKQSKTDTK